MKFYDVLFTLDADGRLQNVVWGDQEAEALYHLLFESWVSRHRKAGSVFPIPEGENSGSFLWDDDTFFFQMLPAPENQTYLLLVREDLSPYLFARALDQVSEGVQIYDKNACVVYFNKVTRQISYIPSGVDPRGRHLLDLYNLDENISTTMTALRTRSPVINRVDHFKTSDGTPMATANTSYPILRGGELLGTMSFDQTEEIVRKNIKRLEETLRALQTYDSRAPQVTFSGYTFDNVIGHSPKLREIVAIARRTWRSWSSTIWTPPPTSMSTASLRWTPGSMPSCGPTTGRAMSGSCFMCWTTPRT